jgi:hypothetical protein
VSRRRFAREGLRSRIREAPVEILDKAAFCHHNPDAQPFAKEQLFLPLRGGPCRALQHIQKEFEAQALILTLSVVVFDGGGILEAYE